jgi:hypothetical protein
MIADKKGTHATKHETLKAADKGSGSENLSHRFPGQKRDRSMTEDDRNGCVLYDCTASGVLPVPQCPAPSPPIQGIPAPLAPEEPDHPDEDSASDSPL